MNKTLLYIIYVAALLLTACKDDAVVSSDLLSGAEKTPLTVSALVDMNGTARTRAVDKSFDNGDVLIAYLRHVTWNGAANGARESVAADQAPRLVSFTKGTDAMTAYAGADITPIGTGVALGLASSNTQQTSDLTATPTLYWDDFSSSNSDATDLRTAGHYLQSYYGYCYNGSPAYGEDGTHISADLDEGTGVLGWTIATDQRTGFKTSDLLWSYEQTPVAYGHATPRSGLVLPYTHAMSKVTIVVVCSEGFDSSSDNLAGTSVFLKNMNTVATVTAPTGTIVAVPGVDNVNIKDVTMQPLADGVINVTKSFSALIVPTEFSDGLDFARINNVDGNNYSLSLSDAVMRTADENDADWASKLTGYTEGTKRGTTQSGIHYMITVTINKQGITVSATIQNWEDVDANGVGVIQFDKDIKTTGNLDIQTLKDNGFDIYQSANVAEPAYSKVTTYSYDEETTPKWTRSDEIYWPNGTDRFYFRSLSNAKTEVGQALTMENGRDVLWGTTAAHGGPEAEKPYSLTYSEGDPIAPRTGDVPLQFYHPMAKVTFNLVDANKDAVLPDGVDADDYANPLNPRLNLENATIQITNMSTGGTINLHDGTVTPTTPVAAKMLSEDTEAEPKRMGFYVAKANGVATGKTENVLDSYIVTPQTFTDREPATDDAYIIVTLADGATYRAKLNSCQVQTGTDGEGNPIYESITQWQRGKHYVYTITLSKETITFRAMIKDWEDTTGGGIANLEWD